jgi:hypothetical protein
LFEELVLRELARREIGGRHYYTDAYYFFVQRDEPGPVVLFLVEDEGIVANVTFIANGAGHLGENGELPVVVAAVLGPNHSTIRQKGALTRGIHNHLRPDVLLNSFRGAAAHAGQPVTVRDRRNRFSGEHFDAARDGGIEQELVELAAPRLPGRYRLQLTIDPGHYRDVEGILAPGAVNLGPNFDRIFLAIQRVRQVNLSELASGLLR